MLGTEDPEEPMDTKKGVSGSERALLSLDMGRFGPRFEDSDF